MDEYDIDLDGYPDEVESKERHLHYETVIALPPEPGTYSCYTITSGHDIKSRGGIKMPIVEFANNQQLETWINECTSPDKYRILVTSEKEVIVRPTKSTDTLDFGYLRFLTMEKLEGTINKLSEMGYKVMEIASYHWDKERFSNITVSN